MNVIDRVFNGSPIFFPQWQVLGGSALGFCLPATFGSSATCAHRSGPRQRRFFRWRNRWRKWPLVALKTRKNHGKNQEKPVKTRKNHGKFMEIWDFSTELGKKSFNVRELVGWTRKQQEREGSNPLRLSKLGYPVCISKRFGVLLFATRHINIVP